MFEYLIFDVRNSSIRLTPTTRNPTLYVNTSATGTSTSVTSLSRISLYSIRESERRHNVQRRSLSLSLSLSLRFEVRSKPPKDSIIIPLSAKLYGIMLYYVYVEANLKFTTTHARIPAVNYNELQDIHHTSSSEQHNIQYNKNDTIVHT